MTAIADMGPADSKGYFRHGKNNKSHSGNLGRPVGMSASLVSLLIMLSPPHHRCTKYVSAEISSSVVTSRVVCDSSAEIFILDRRYGSHRRLMCFSRPQVTSYFTRAYFALSAAVAYRSLSFDHMLTMGKYFPHNNRLSLLHPILLVAPPWCVDYTSDVSLLFVVHNYI